MGLPFMPVKGYTGSDYLSVRPDIKSVRNPYDGQEVLVVPAINVDVCLLHGYSADDKGNVLIDRFSDSDLAAKGAGLTIVSVEERVADVERATNRATKQLSHLHVDYLVEAPGGAKPTACPGSYEQDIPYLRSYLAEVRGGRLHGWLRDHLSPGT